MGPRHRQDHSPTGTPALAVCPFPASGPPIRTDPGTPILRAASRRLLPPCAGASRGPRRRLAVVPLIPDQRYYGESPASLRRGPREGPPLHSSHQTPRITDAGRGTVCDCRVCEETILAHPRCTQLAPRAQLWCSPDGCPRLIAQITDSMALMGHILYSAPCRLHSLLCSFERALMRL